LLNRKAAIGAITSAKPTSQAFSAEIYATKIKRTNGIQTPKKLGYSTPLKPLEKKQGKRPGALGIFRGRKIDYWTSLLNEASKKVRARLAKKLLLDYLT
jgi:hypothetical protein